MHSMEPLKILKQTLVYSVKNLKPAIIHKPLFRKYKSLIWLQISNK